MANIYWKDEDVKSYIKEWRDARDERGKTQAYNKLVPYFNLMFKNIRIRYFTRPQHEYHYDKTDCITQCFLAIDKYDSSKSAFSFFSNVIKNYLISGIRDKITWKNTYNYNDSEYENEEENPLLCTPEPDENRRQEAKEQLVAIIEKYEPRDDNEKYIVEQLIYFIWNFDARTIAQISSYLYKLDVKPTDVYRVGLKIFGKPVFHSKAYNNEVRLDEKAEKVSAENYYDDPVRTYNYMHYGRYDNRK
jgi:hypothetical protein